jgi:hypothetical protein
MVGVWSLRILQPFESVTAISGPESFLLIVRTERILTSHAETSETGCDTSEYRRILGVSSIWPTTHRIVSDAGGSTHCTLWEFYLRHFCYYLLMQAARSFLSSSSCRHEGRTVSSSLINQRAPRTVSEDPSSICSILLDRCLPLAFMPYASRTRRSNPMSVRCSFCRIDRTMTANDRKSHPLTTSGNRSKNGSTAASRFDNPPTAKVKTLLFGPFGRTCPQPKTRTIASRISR